MRKFNEQEHYKLMRVFITGFSDQFLSSVDKDLAVATVDGTQYLCDPGYGVRADGIPRAIILSISDKGYIDAHENKEHFSHFELIKNA